MSYSLTEIKGLEAADAAKLEKVGVSNTEQLLERVRTPRDRKALADETGISGDNILAWANRADLMRVKGVGRQYGDLLEASGVDTVPELAQRNPANLRARMAEVNEEQSLVGSLPSESQVADWVGQAKDLGRVLEY